MEEILQQINDVIDLYGNTVQIKDITYAATTDEWGDLVESADTVRTVKAVSDAKILRRLQFGQYGALSSSSMVLLIKAEENLSTETNRVLVDGQSYRIMSIEEYKVGDLRLAQSLVLGSE